MMQGIGCEWAGHCSLSTRADLGSLSPYSQAWGRGQQPAYELWVAPGHQATSNG